MTKKRLDLFPGYRLSPDGKDYRAFDRAEDVPAGWLRESPESFVKKGLGTEKPSGRKPKETINEPLDL